MIQAQFLCYILDKRDFSICELNNIGVEYFPEYKDEFNFIQSHYAKFHNTPDKETFIARFTDFKFFEVQESPKFLLDELSEEYVYNKTYKVFEAVNDEMMNGDSRKGVEILLSKIPELTAQLNMNSTDLLHDGADKRFQQYCDMGEDISKFYMPTGLPELDKLIGGWNRRNDFIAICGRPGAGKCLAAGTKVLMGDGTTKPVEDIKIGDKVQSLNCINTVTELHHGKAQGYTIIPTAGEPFTVSANHILTLYYINSDRHIHEMRDLYIEDFLKLSPREKRHYRIYKPSVEYSHKELLIPPYILGTWLGDGTSNCPDITTPDPEIKQAWEDYAKSENYLLNARTNHSKGKATTYALTHGIRNKNIPNKIKQLLKHYNLLNNKHIPLDYLTADRQQRMELLAGIIDTDGSSCNKHSYELTLKQKEMITQVAQLARGLGFRVGKINPKPVTLNGKHLMYYRITINGAVETIPIRVPHKKVVVKNTTRVLSLNRFTVEPVGEIEYYGFACTGDHRFMLWDNTLTHNSWWLDYFLLKAAEQGYNVGFYSGEMDEAQVGYRLDTFMSHISNFKIAKGHSDIFDDYKAHIENMKKLKGKLITCTPNTLGGAATPAKLRAFCDKYKIDILGIDQYSLLDSSKNIKQRNEKFEDISKELKTMQLELGIPVLINAQLNRGATAEGVTSPGTEHLAGSDRLGQDCSIVLSITHKDDYVTLVSSKIRDANSKINLTYKWDIDKGILEYKADNENSNPPAEHKVRRKCEGEDISF